jgi:hypothetical protein
MKFFSDIDECEFDPCDPDATCENSAGSFTCTCGSGYEGDGFKCEKSTVNTGNQPVAPGSPKPVRPLIPQNTSAKVGLSTAAVILFIVLLL